MLDSQTTSIVATRQFAEFRRLRYVLHPALMRLRLVEHMLSRKEICDAPISATRRLFDVRGPKGSERAESN